MLLVQVFPRVVGGCVLVLTYRSDDYHGIWKRADAIQHAPNWWSIHYLTGFCSLQYLIFLFHAVVAASMMFGYRTKLVSAVGARALNHEMARRLIFS